MSKYSDFVKTGIRKFSIGTVADWKMNSNVAGWLTCDGSQIDESTYPDLADLYLRNGVLSDVVSGNASIPGGSNTRNAIISPDGAYVVVITTDPSFVVLSTTDYSTVFTEESIIEYFEGGAFSPDGSKFVIVTSSGDPSTLHEYNTLDWTQAPVSTSVPSSAWVVCFSPDGNQLLYGGWGENNATLPSMRVLLAQDWSLVYSFNADSGHTRSVAFSPDGTIIASLVSQPPYIRAYNAGDGSEISGIPPLGDFPQSLVFSPDGTWLAAVHYNTLPGLVVYDTSTWEVISGTPEFVSEFGVTLDVSPDGKFLHIASDQMGSGMTIKVDGWVEYPDVFFDGENNSQPGKGSFSSDGMLYALSHQRWYDRSFSVYQVPINLLGFFQVPDLAPVRYGNAVIQPMIKSEE